MGVGAKLTPTGTGSAPVIPVTSADNGLGLNGTTVELGFPLIRNTVIDADSFDFSLLNVGNWQIQSISGADQWAIFGDAFGLTTQGLDGLGNSSSFGISPSSITHIISNGGAINSYDKQSNITIDIIDDSVRENNFVRVNTNNSFSLIDNGTGQNSNHGFALNGRNSNGVNGANIYIESLTSDAYELEFNSSHFHSFSAIDDGFRYELGDTKRGIYFEGLTEWEMEFFPLTTTLFNRGFLNNQSSGWEYGNTATGAVNSVIAGSTSSIISSSDGVTVNNLEVFGSVAGFVSINTQSNLGIRESIDYSANYVPLSLVNRTYSDSHVNGLNITNAPAVNQVLQYDGANVIWATIGGGSGTFEFGETYPISSIDMGTASGNTIYYTSKIMPADIDITQLGCFITSAGADVVTLGVYDNAGNLLVQSNLPAGYGTGFEQSAVFPAITLNAKQTYWFAIKADLGATNFGTQPCFTSTLIAQSQFYAPAGLPALMGGAASNISTYIQFES